MHETEQLLYLRPITLVPKTVTDNRVISTISARNTIGYYRMEMKLNFDINDIINAIYRKTPPPPPPPRTFWQSLTQARPTDPEAPAQTITGMLALIIGIIFIIIILFLLLFKSGSLAIKSALSLHSNFKQNKALY